MEKLSLRDRCDANVQRIGGIKESLGLRGIFTAVCRDRNGDEKWRETMNNTIMTLGKNAALDAFLAGSGYTVTGPYMGLISSVGYSAIAAADTMSSHAGWAEAGVTTNYPLYNGDRKTCVFAAASGGSKALSTGLVFTCETTGGTVKGMFLVFSSGAVATKGDTNGVLLSAGLFTGGDKVLGVGDTVTVSYTMSA